MIALVWLINNYPHYFGLMINGNIPILLLGNGVPPDLMTVETDDDIHVSGGNCAPDTYGML